MMELTFKAYLTDYIQRLSYHESTDILQLAMEAGTNNFRLRAPLILYVIYTNKTDLLTQTFNSDEYKQHLKWYLEDCKNHNHSPDWQ